MPVHVAYGEYFILPFQLLGTGTKMVFCLTPMLVVSGMGLAPACVRCEMFSLF